MIAGIGGIFIYSTQPERLAGWYEEVLGIRHESPEGYNVWYATFFYQDSQNNKKTYTIWSIHPAKEELDKSKKAFTINLRIYDLESFVTQIRSKGVEVKGVESHPEGKFAWLQDPDGNYIELWEDTYMYDKSAS